MCDSCVSERLRDDKYDLKEDKLLRAIMSIRDVNWW